MKNEQSLKTGDTRRAELRRLLLEYRRDPNFATFQSLNRVVGQIVDIASHLKDQQNILADLEVVRGKDGDTPVKGVDYFTEKEKTDLLLEATPIKGLDYFTDEEISKFLEAVKPVKGRDYFDGKPGLPGPKPIAGVDYPIPQNGEPGRTPIAGVDFVVPEGKPGRDGSPDSGEQIVNKINDLPIEPDKQIDAKHIRGLKDFYNVQYPFRRAGGIGIEQIQDEGVQVGSTIRKLNFVGSSVSVAASGETATVTVTGGTITGSDTQILYFNGNDNPAGASSFTFNDASGQVIAKPIGSNGEVLNVRNLANSDIFIVDTTGFVTINAEITLGGRILPDVTNTHDLGSGSFAFRNIYFNGVLGDGINSVSLANICTLNTAQTISAAKTFGTTTKLQFTDANAFINASSSGNLVLQGATSTTVGVAGDIVLGDSTLRIMYPQTHKKIDRGSAANSFNDDYLGGLMKRYNDIATVSGGIPSELATVDLTAQGAAITATTVYAVPSTGAGMYRISWVATVTRAATTSSVLGGTNGFQLKYTDADDSVVKTSAPTTVTDFTSAGNTTGTQVSGVFVAYCKASTNLQYLFDYTSVGATTMQYNLHIKVEAM